jgi:hypothetical protein
MRLTPGRQNGLVPRWGIAGSVGAYERDKPMNDTIVTEVKEEYVTYIPTTLDLIIGLGANREVTADLKAELKKMVEEFEAQPRVVWLKEQIKTAVEKAEGLEENIKRSALETYEVNKEKKPFPGVEIKHFKVAKITDEARAFSYAFDKLPKALKLDKKYIEDYAKKTEGMVDLDFVEITDEPRAQIASDLLKHLQSS